MMRFLHQDQSSFAPPVVEGVVCQPVQFVNHVEATRQECFVQGTERAEVVLQDTTVTASRILSPLNQAIYALDPEIPPTQQQIVIKAQLTQGTTVKWRIDNEIVSDQPEFNWLPRPGKHNIELLHQHTLQPLDSIHIEIRG